MKKSNAVHRVAAGIAAILIGTCPVLGQANSNTGSTEYPYQKSGIFASFVADSFRVKGAKQPQTAGLTFFTYMGDAIPLSMDKARSRLARINDVQARADAERQVCADLHRSIKKRIPKFSLDRGFEFYNTVSQGERQCFLQSVVIASLLQRAGVPAGVAMVFRNEKGASCNNGHAVAVARLADNRDIVVDASDPAPFMTHQGLMVSIPAGGGYAYVEPVYDGTHRITAYRNLRNKRTLPPPQVAMLDVRFLRSQFDCYRGERTPGGLLTPPLATASGLMRSEKWLSKSVAECPQNPLALYMLARVQEHQQKVTEARRSYNAAYSLYSRYGWVPPEESRRLVAIRGKKSVR